VGGRERQLRFWRMGEWVQDVLSGGGLAVLFALVLAENLFPPIPSEVILPLAGFLVSEGEMTVVGALVAATAGSTAGALILYTLGRYGGRPVLLRHGRLLRLSRQRLDRADAWFDEHGPKIVFLGRMVPGVRSVVSIPAGMSEMPLVTFVALTLAGSAIWNAALIGAGWALGDNWERVTAAIESANVFLIAGALALVGLTVIRRRARARRPQSR
jgi:membrane protein DedA with SNARE-associated domain